MADTVPFETRTLEQMARATAVSPKALIGCQEPGGSMQSVEARRLFGKLLQVDTAYETEAAPAGLQGDLAWPAFSCGFVYADPTPAKNGWWRKIGAPGAGSWEQFEKLSSEAAAEVQGLVGDAQDARDDAVGAAAGLQHMLPATFLPAVWTAGYWWRRPRGTVIRDFIGNKHVDIATAFPNGLSFDGDGWLILANQGAKLPAQGHKAQLHIFEVEEGGGTGYYFATSTGKAAGKGQVGGLATWTKVYGVQGWGPHQIFRRGDLGGTGGYEWEGGGVVGVAAVAADNPTGQPVLAAASSALAGKASWIRHICSLYAATEPTEAEISQAAQYLRPELAEHRKWLRVEDCPREAIPVFAFGESTDTSTLFAAATASFAGDVMTVIGFNGNAPRALEAGHALKASANADLNQYVVAQLTSNEPDGAMGKRGTYRVSWAPAVTGNQAVYYPDMTVAQQNQRANNVRVVARNSNSSGTTGVSMDRLTMRPPYDNQAAPNVKSIAPKSGWAYGFVRAANEAPDDGRFYDLVFVSQGSTQDCPGGSEAAQTTSTNYVNALGGTTNVTAALSRNVKNLVSAGMVGSLLNRNVHREEQRSRKLGVGYTVVHWVKSWGLNTAFIGTGAVPDVATPLQWLEDDRQFIITFVGIADPQMTIVDPHQPDGDGDGFADGVLGGDPDYPNSPAGVNRAAALANERDAGTAFKAAHLASVDRIDGNVVHLNSANGDRVHPSFAGQDKLGGLIHANVRAKRNVRTTPVF
ncbi:hypothetical protein [Sphingopyxis sp. YF1]|uniref:hypothetical protein n=1 Tax=Sphingopyxis sp. YF1 TaxID=2482763 RepID=UPI001F60B704|nr:hypothetical protein [Sphingopyxis sp. YF1]